jgi:hypothetical protein
MSGNKSLMVNSKGLFKIKPTTFLGVSSVSKTMLLLNELSFKIAGSAINKFPFCGLIVCVLN